MILKYALKRIMTEVIFISFKFVKLNAVRIYIEFCRFTGRARVIRSHWLARFYFELSGNSK